MTQLKQAQDLAAFAAILSDPSAKRIVEVVAAVSLIDDDAAARNAKQALALGFTAAATQQMQEAMGNGQSGVFRDVSIERNGAIVGRFTGGHVDSVARFGDRLVHASADAPALPAPMAAE